MNDLERFLARLIETLRARDADGLHRPLAVEALRNNVLPYRLHRAAIGLTSIEDYDLLVLRLVAEEDGLVRTFPPEAAVQARAEGALPNPDADYDNYAWNGSTYVLQNSVRVGGSSFLPNPDLDLAEHLSSATIQLGAATVARIDELARGVGRQLVVAPDTQWQPAPPAETGEAPLPPAAPIEIAAPPIEAPPPPKPAELPLFDAMELESGSGPFGSVADHCSACQAELPSHRAVAFCPFCGQQVGVRRCARCKEELEPGWSHCAGCGHPAVPKGPVP